MDHDQLTRYADSLQAAAEASSLQVIGAVPEGDGGWTVTWPDPDDVDGFVHAAVAAGVRMFYLRRLRADELCQVDGSDLVARHRGQVAAVEAAWVHHQVVHRLEQVAGWVPALAEQLDDAHVDGLYAARSEADRLARTLLAHLPDNGLSNDQQAYTLVADHLDEITPKVAGRVARRLIAIDREEMRPRREAEMARQARRHLQGGATKVATAEKVGITVNVLNRILQQNPPPSGHPGP